MSGLEGLYKELADRLVEYRDDPLAYVRWVFPWGKKGTDLENHAGPRPWQEKFLTEWGNKLKSRKFDGTKPVAPIQMARSSGHGIGKSALTAWIIKFILDTRPQSKGVVTSNTLDQLRTKTWGELAKWHNLSLTERFFQYRNVRGNMCMFSKTNPDTWRVDAMTCDANKSEAFAGLHAVNSTPFYIFDEASAIPEAIWQVAHGGLTDGEPMWFVFGNPTRNTGSFRWCFGRNRHRWNTDQIDSRTVEGTNHELFAEWVEDYGEDSDFVRVRIKGVFPRAAVCQLIPEDHVEAAMGKHLHPMQYDYAPIIFGVDVARYGDDKSTLYMRQGMASWKLGEWRGIDNMTYAGIISQKYAKFRPHAIFIDAGHGAGVIDRLRQLGVGCIEVPFSSTSNRRECLNKRAQIWCDMRDWLKDGGAIPDERDLRDDLVSQEYFFSGNDKIQLVKKKDMKKMGLASPDDADGLALTFAEKVVKPEIVTPEVHPSLRVNRGQARTSYDVLRGRR